MKVFLQCLSVAIFSSTALEREAPLEGSHSSLVRALKNRLQVFMGIHAEDKCETDWEKLERRHNGQGSAEEGNTFYYVFCLRACKSLFLLMHCGFGGFAQMVTSVQRSSIFKNGLILVLFLSRELKIIFAARPSPWIVAAQCNEPTTNQWFISWKLSAVFESM